MWGGGLGNIEVGQTVSVQRLRLPDHSLPRYFLDDLIAFGLLDD